MNERENYLDSLLNSVNGKGKDKSQEAQPETEDEFLKNYDKGLAEIDEDNFLKEFEKNMVQPELDLNMGLDIDLDLDTLDDEGPDFRFEEDFAMEEPQEEAKEEAAEEEQPPERRKFPDDVKNIVNDVKNGLRRDEDAVLLEDIQLEAGGTEGAFTGVDGIPEDLNLEAEGSRNDIPLEADLNLEDIPELSQIGNSYGGDFMVNTLDHETQGDLGTGEDQEIMDMLNGMPADSELEEIGNMLREDEKEDGPADDLDVMAKELVEEIDSLNLEDEEESPVEEEEKDSSKKKEKKEKKAKNKKPEGEEAKEGTPKAGFFQKLSRLLFGEDDEAEESPSAQPDTIPDIMEIENMSDENIEILRQLEGQKADAPEDEAAKKKREKQEKKAQKKKEQEEKKAQKKKEQEVKKAANEQKKRERQEKKVLKLQQEGPVVKSKPLPKGPVIIIMLLGISLVILVNLLSSLLDYNTSLSEAKGYYSKGDYVSAYTCLSEDNVKKADVSFYQTVRLAAILQQQLKSYEIYQEQAMYPEALNALICGVGKYDTYLDDAHQVNAGAEFENLLTQIQNNLANSYNMNLDQARELYAISEKEDYTRAVRGIIQGMGLLEEQE